MVMQIEADNPGVWPFHCHVAWHMSGGLYVNAISYPKERLWVISAYRR
jgi:hypothetical protein